MGLGNVISQTLIEKRPLNAVDWPRAARFSTFGFFVGVGLLF
jgi:hypothetical protein